MEIPFICKSGYGEPCRLLSDPRLWRQNCLKHLNYSRLSPDLLGHSVHIFIAFMFILITFILEFQCQVWYNQTWMGSAKKAAIRLGTVVANISLSWLIYMSLAWQWPENRENRDWSMIHDIYANKYILTFSEENACDAC